MKAFRKLKKSQPLMRSLVVLLTVIFTPDYSSGQCNVDNRDFTVCGTCDFQSVNGPWGQTFKPCSDGTLSSISFITNYAVSSSQNLDLAIYSGVPGATTPLGVMQNITTVNANAASTPFTSGQYTTIDVSSLNISVVSGNTYSFEFLNGPGPGPVNLFYEGSNGVDHYTAGELYYNGATASSQSVPNADMFFNIAITAAASNTPPTASSVSFSGTLEVGEVLTGSYSYADMENDSESGSAYQWFRADDNTGTNKASISGATSQTYTLQAADANKYISFAVTPNDGTDAGTTVESTLNGSVACVYPSGSSAYTEDFEAIPVSGTSFTHASTNIEFYTTDHLGVSTISNAGINGSDRFLDNLGSCLSSPGKVGSITTNGVADFYVHDFWLFPSENCYNVGTNGTVIIRGKKAGSTVFSRTIQSSEMNSNGSVDKGFTFIDMSNYECYSIDELEVEVTGNLDYIAIDDFKFTATPINTGVLLATSPTLTFSNDNGFSDSRATDGEGGSVTISDIDIEAYPINSTGTALTVDPLEYHDNTDWTGYQAIITYGAALTHYGWAIKSANGDNFSLQSLDFMDWGGWDGATFVIEAFDNGSSIDTIWFAGNTTSAYVNLALGAKLSSSFQNIDEIRFYRQDGVDSWTALNNIHVSSPNLNTPPGVNANTGVTVTENQSIMIGSGALHGYDWEISSDTELTFTITTAVTNGFLFYDSNWNNAFDTGERKLLLDSTFTQDDVNNMYLRYTSTTDNDTIDSFGFTLSDPDGGELTGQTFEITITPVNDAPVASTLSFSGYLREDSTLTATYTYTDAEGDIESGTTFQWFRADDNAGTNKASISGATSQTYTLQAADVDKYISFAVTPNDGVDAGTQVESSLQGAVIGTLSATISSQTNANCNGSSDGSATVAVTGGLAPHSYSWSPSGGTAATATGLAAGTYTVTVTDANSTTTNASVTITEPVILSGGEIQ